MTAHVSAELPGDPPARQLYISTSLANERDQLELP
jgi:hypothetical protein